jgi:hypothetical protein
MSTDWLDRMLYPRPTEDRIYAVREPVEGAVCPSCGSGDVRRYPIANHFGPRMTTTCQSCLHILKVERPALEDNWPPYRSVTYDWAASPAERAARSTSFGSGGDKVDPE